MTDFTAMVLHHVVVRLVIAKTRYSGHNVARSYAVSVLCASHGGPAGLKLGFAPQDCVYAGTGTIQYPLFFRRQSIIGRAIPVVLTVGLDCPSRLLDAWTALPQAMRSCGLRSSCGSRIDGGTAVRQRRWRAL
jgi:hypothetical protein